MSQHEYVVTVMSLIIALVLAKLIEGLYQAVRGRLWWIHTAWVLNRLVAALLLATIASNGLMTYLTGNPISFPAYIGLFAAAAIGMASASTRCRQAS